ncbi:MAG: PAS domain-containing sensor histidine kinase, partial [Hyphomicrobiaceae bacterium]|nr:PAS domain-containing sensor histidine kinase [Hyphomicrobiaceae bacterium]
MPASHAAPQHSESLEEGSSPLNPGDRAFWIGLSVVVLSLVSALATYFILTGLTPIAPRGEIVFVVLFFNVVLILAMIAMLAWQMAGLGRAWREKLPGARLHIRIVVLFSLIAALPALVLAVAATVTFSRSLDGWFSSRTRSIIISSRQVATAYLDEHGQVIRTDIVNMARDLDRAAEAIGDDKRQLQQQVMVQAGLRDLPVAYVIDADGRPLIETTASDKYKYEQPPIGALRVAAEG